MLEIVEREAFGSWGALRLMRVRSNGAAAHVLGAGQHGFAWRDKSWG